MVVSPLNNGKFHCPPYRMRGQIFHMAANIRYILMTVSVWNIWRFISKPFRNQTGFDVLYVSDGYMKHVQYIHKHVQFYGRTEKRKWRKVKKLN
jgi:hypothetical protein